MESLIKYLWIQFKFKICNFYQVTRYSKFLLRCLDKDTVGDNSAVPGLEQSVLDTWYLLDARYLFDCIFVWGKYWICRTALHGMASEQRADSDRVPLSHLELGNLTPSLFIIVFIVWFICKSIVQLIKYLTSDSIGRGSLYFQPPFFLIIFSHC